MIVILRIGAGFCCGYGLLMLCVAENAIHEIEVMICMVMGCILCSGAVIASEVKKIGDRMKAWESKFEVGP